VGCSGTILKEISLEKTVGIVDLTRGLRLEFQLRVGLQAAEKH
jgi:hypothetical protein